jgi:hypothetical protein
MMREHFIFLLTSLASIHSLFAQEPLPLCVHQDQRYLMTSDGKPFFWLADTAWELLHRGDRDDITKYLDARQKQGFNVIQTVLLAEFDGLNVPTQRGFKPLRDNNPTTPWTEAGDDNDYWDEVEWFVDQAAQRNIYVAFVPTWGEWVTPRFSKPPIFETADQGYAYGRFLGERFGKHQNLVWILGGDRQPTEWPHAREVWQAMAEGITDGRSEGATRDGSADWNQTLMTYHSMTSSSKWWHEDPWIDFHMWGTYHSQKDWPRSFQIAQADYNLADPKPTLNAEPCYEELPRDYKGDNGWFEQYEVRRAAWWSVLSGTLGHTYGAHPIWQLSGKAEVEPPHIPLPDLSPVRMKWQEALQLPAASQMIHLRTLMESIDYVTYKPENSLLNDTDAPLDEGHQVAGKSSAAILVYSPQGRAVNLKPNSLDGVSNGKASWFNPRSAEESSAFLEKTSEGFVAKAPTVGPTEDWVLIVRKGE